MPAGALNALAGHEGEDLTSVAALLRMLPPLKSTLDSYRERAKAAKKSLGHAVLLEAVVQS